MRGNHDAWHSRDFWREGRHAWPTWRIYYVVKIMQAMNNAAHATKSLSTMNKHIPNMMDMTAYPCDIRIVSRLHDICQLAGFLSVLSVAHHCHGHWLVWSATPCSSWGGATRTSGKEPLRPRCNESLSYASEVNIMATGVVLRFCSAFWRGRHLGAREPW